MEHLPLVGRQADLDQLDGMVASGRCVSVVGPAGLGKSALVAEFARTWSGEVVSVNLHDSLGVGTLEALASAPPASGTLVVIDGLTGPWPSERDAVAGLAQGGCAVLATSRDLMGVPGELVLPLAPLRNRGQSGEPADNPALDLLTARIVEAGGSLEDQAAAGALVDLLDGVPGAIELAAAHVPTAGLRSVLEGIQARFAEKEQRGDRVVRSIILDLVREWESRTTAA